MSSASPTCRLSLTSRPAKPLRRMARDAMLRLVFCDDIDFRDVNPWDEGDVNSPRLGWNHSSLMTGRCHWRGSEDEESRFRWR